MINYEVTATVEATLADAYERFMREHHIPDLLATGCFLGASFARGAEGRYRMRYEMASEGDLERYLAIHAPGVREAFSTRFPHGVTLGREVWHVIKAWHGPSGPVP